MPIPRGGTRPCCNCAWTPNRSGGQNPRVSSTRSAPPDLFERPRHLRVSVRHACASLARCVSVLRLPFVVHEHGSHLTTRREDILGDRLQLRGQRSEEHTSELQSPM